MAEAEAGGAVELRGLPPDVPDELLMLYFENRRRSGGGPVSSWQRLGRGGVLTFREPADAQRVLAQGTHVLQRVRLSLRPAPPWAPARLLLQGLPQGLTPQRLEQHVQALLRAAGRPELPCRALASPRPDRALVQLSEPLSEADVGALEQPARALALEGAVVSLARVPQARAVRVVGGPHPADPLLLELYLENERRSGGGPLESLCSLPGDLGTVVNFQRCQVAERVLQRDHWLQGTQLSLVPHYEALEPEGLAADSGGGDCLAKQGPGASEDVLLEAGGPTRARKDMGTAESVVAQGQSGTSLRTGPMGLLEQEGTASLRPEGYPGQEGLVSPEPVGSPEQAGPVILEPVGSPEQAGPVIPKPVGSPEQAGPVIPEPVGSPEQAGPVIPEPVGSPEQAGPVIPEPVGSPGQVGPVEMVLSMEPGALRFMQLYHGDLLASLGDIDLFPLEGTDVTGFQLRGAPASCQAAEEFLRSLLGSISRHVLNLKLPGSAGFLLGLEGQHLLQELEAQFQCVFGTEWLARAALDTDPGEVDPTEALQALPGQDHTPWPPHSDQEAVSLEEVRELLATLEGPDSGEQLLLEREEEPEEGASSGGLEEASQQPSEGGPVALGTGATPLEEEAALQLALHWSLEPRGQAAEQEEVAAVQRALALSLLEQPRKEAEEPPGGGAQLVVHAAFEQDLGEVDRALGAALEGQLQEETVDTQGHMLPAGLQAQLERCHGVSVALRGDRAVLRGFGAQPTRAARHLAALLTDPRDWNLAGPLAASAPTCPQQRPAGPSSGLECLAEGSSEFQEVVRAFCNSLGAAHSRIHVVRVERVSTPLLQQQYELHRQRMEQRCDRRPVEQVLYHGTSASAVPDICAHGFNRSFCGRNGTLYGQGVYFARCASLSVQDRYSPPDARGHKAVFVARVLTGDYVLGRRELRAPPLRDSGLGPQRYDSAVDCLGQPSIFVIFYDTQALPTHLITCENTLQASPGDLSGRPDHSPAP